MLLLTGALVAPYFVDWTGYRADFETAASQILGRTVTVKGAASARLLPFPSVTFEDVKVGDDPEAPAMTIEKFSMDAELAPFLKGEVLIFDMRVEKPRMFVQISPDGTVDWVLRASAPKGVEKLTLENVTIIDGAVEVDDQAAGRLNVIEAVNATVSAKSLAGPWRFDGTLSFNDEPISIGGSTTPLDDKGRLPLRLLISPAHRPMLAETTGYVSLKDNALAYGGDFTLRPAALTDPGSVQLRDGDGAVAGTAAKSAGFHVKGKFEARQEGLTLPSFRFETGPKNDPYFAEGSGKILWGKSPRFDLTADGAQVSFDSAADGDIKGVTLADRMSAVEAFLAQVPAPDMPGEIKIDLPAVVAGDTTIRDVAFTASPSGLAWEIKSLRATLPGRTKLEASGRLGTGDAFGFSGKLLAASSQPSGLSTWLTGSADDAVRKLTALGFDADVTLTKSAQLFDNLELALGATTLKGRLERRSDGAKPSLTVTLSGGALDLNDLSALGSILVGPERQNNLAGHDLDAALKAGPVSIDGVEAESVDVALRLKGDQLDIDRMLVTGLEGASMSATAKLSGFPAVMNGTADASFLSPDAAQTFGLLARKFPSATVFSALADRSALYPDLFADTKLDLFASLSGEKGAQDAAVSFSSSAGGGIYSGTATLKGALSEPETLAGKLTIEGHHEDALALLTLAGVATLPVGSPGAATFDAQADGSLKDGFHVTSKLEAEGVNAALSGDFAKTDGQLSGKGHVALTASDIEPYLMAGGATLPDMGQGAAIDLEGDFTSQGRAVSLQGLSGQAAGVNVSGTLGVDPDQTPPRVSGALALERVDLVWLGEVLFGSGSMRSDGGWPAAEFAAQSMAGLQGSVDVAARNAQAGSLGPLSDLKTTLAFGNNSLALRDASAVYRGGQLKGSAEAKNNKGTGLVSGDFTLTGARFEEIMPQGHVLGLADVSGSVSATGITAGGLAAALTGSGAARLREASIAGLNPQAFAEIFEIAGNQERAPETAEMETLTAQHVRGGSAPVARADLSWTAASGAVRFSPFILALPQGRVSIDATANIGGQSASLAGRFDFDPMGHAVTGADPAVPFTLSLKDSVYTASLDAQPMAQFFTQRALEREQARVEAMQEELLESQRLRREVRYYAYLADQRAKKELDRLVAAEEIRVKAAAIQWQKILEEQRAKDAAARRAAEDAQRAKEADAPAPLLVNPQDFQGEAQQNLDLQLPGQ